MTTQVSASLARPADQQPQLAGPAIVSAVLFIVSLLIGLIFGGSLYSSPFLADGKIAQFYAEHGTMVQYVAFFQFAAAIALAVFTAVLWARLRLLAPGATALTYTAAVGGVLAAAFLGLNAVVQWSMSHQGVLESAPVRRALHYLFFALGGFAHVASIGVLVAAVSLIALRAGWMPKWFNVASLVVAGLALLSTLTFVTEATTPLIPLGRFPTLLWAVAVAYLLPRAVTRR